MKRSGACGPDGICIHILILCFETIGPVLLHIVNTCLTSCDFPDTWKHSLVHPIFKSGDPSVISNYRPISIVPIMAKIVERVVQRQLFWYLPTCLTIISFPHPNIARLIPSPTFHRNRSALVSQTASFPAWTVVRSLSFAFWTLANASMSSLMLSSSQNSNSMASTRTGSPLTLSAILSLSASLPLPATERFLRLFLTPWESSRDHPLVLYCSPSSPTTSACTRRTLM